MSAMQVPVFPSLLTNQVYTQEHSAALKRAGEELGALLVLQHGQLAATQQELIEAASTITRLADILDTTSGDETPVNQRITFSLSDALDIVTGRTNYLATAALYPGMRNESLRQSVLAVQSEMGLLRVRQQSTEETIGQFQTTLGSLGELQSSFTLKLTQNNAAIAALYAQGELQAADIEELQAENEAQAAELVRQAAHDLVQDTALAVSQANDLSEQARLTVLETQQGILAAQQALLVAQQQQDAQAIAALQQQLGQLQTKLTADEATLATHTTALAAAQTTATQAGQAAAAAQQKVDATAAALVIAQAATTTAQTTANNAAAAVTTLSNRIREVLGVATPALTLSATGVGSSFTVVVSWAQPFANTDYGVFFSSVGSVVLKNLAFNVQNKTTSSFQLVGTNALGLSLALSASSMDFLIFHT